MFATSETLVDRPYTQGQKGFEPTESLHNTAKCQPENKIEAE